MSDFRPRRSVLYMPGANARALEKAKTLPCDGLILDLEDAVAPDDKPAARDAACAAAASGEYGAREVTIRVNGADTEWHADDLAAACAAGPDAIVVPKVDSADAVLRLVDKAFGGRGEAPVTLPDRFPLSAQLMIQRVEAMVVERLCAALGADGAVRALRRDGDLQELAPFRADTPLAVLELEVMEGLRAPWPVTLALPFATLAELFGHGDRPPAALAATPRPANPTAAPFADVPLPLTAVLVDMQVPLATISALEPGMVLPVAVARAVPLSVGGSVIARGTVGAQDDRVAIKISTIT